jgi:hypothetical protein
VDQQHNQAQRQELQMDTFSKDSLTLQAPTFTVRTSQVSI